MPLTTARPPVAAPARRRSRLALLTAAAFTASLFTVPAVAAAAPAGAAGAPSASSAQVAAAAPVAALVQAKPRKKRAKKKKVDNWKPKQGAVFNSTNEARNSSRSFLIEQQVIKAIQHAPKGSRIRMVMFSFDRLPVSNALIAAKKRGVHVQLIINEHEWTPATVALSRALGPKLRKVVTWVKVKGSKKKKRVVRYKVRNSFLFRCQASCRGDLDIQHSKFITFSRTGAARNVVMLGSANMKINGVINQYNDWFTLNRMPKMYSTFVEIFKEMRQDRIFKDAHRIYNFSKGKYQLELLPFLRRGSTAKTKWTPYRDPIMRMLRPVSCTGADTADGRTIIRVNMHAWDGTRGKLLAQRFRELYGQGCNVMINVGYASRLVQNTLAVPTGRGVVPVRSSGFDDDDDGEIDRYTHGKQLLINGKYAGVKNQKVVITGSSNYQNSGLWGDEILLRMYSPTYYNQYVANWKDMWLNHSHNFWWSVTYNRGTGKPQYTYSNGGLGINSKEWRDQ